MGNRKKRMRKGILSLEKQKALHEEKRKKAVALGDETLVAYYDKEIEKFLQEQKKRKEKLAR